MYRLHMYLLRNLYNICMQITYNYLYTSSSGDGKKTFRMLTPDRHYVPHWGPNLFFSSFSYSHVMYGLCMFNNGQVADDEKLFYVSSSPSKSRTRHHLRFTVTMLTLVM